MKKNNLIPIHKSRYSLLLTATLISITIILSAMKTFSQQQKYWEAPKNADTLVNPYKNRIAFTEKGKILYTNNCSPCHGVKGKGDGEAGLLLKPRPQDITSDLVQKQSEGAIFWKITTGKPPMASYKTSLTDAQRWQLVNYIRQLKSETK